MAVHEASYRLLQDPIHYESKETIDDAHSPRSFSEPRISFIHRLQAAVQSKYYIAPLWILSGILNLVLAALLLKSYLDLKVLTKGVTETGASVVSAYAGLSPDRSVHFPYSSGYGPEVTNHSLLDERWEAIDINSGVVAISDEWAAEHNLALTQRFPWDTSKGVYLVTAFHTLHCLKNIHRILYDAHHGRPLSRDIGHAMHCVDHMRKDAMCEANDFLLPSPKSRYGSPGPKGQSRVCKNWDALVAWSQEHDACYQHLSDDEETFAEEHDEIERYAGCAPSSPYFQTMRAYFDSTGSSL